jgi:hypothetical protein
MAKTPLHHVAGDANRPAVESGLSESGPWTLLLQEAERCDSDDHHGHEGENRGRIQPIQLQIILILTKVSFNRHQ